MSLRIYNSGYYVAMMRPLAVPVLVASNLFFAWAALMREQVKVVPTSYFVGSNGNVVTSVCDPNSKLNNQNVAFDLMDRLTQVMYAYSRGDVQGYSARYTAFKNSIDSRSPAEGKIRGQVASNLGDVSTATGPIFGEKSTFEADRSMFVIQQTSEGTWNIGVQGVQTITSDKGDSKFQIAFKATIVEGDASALYRVNDFNLVERRQIN